MMTLLKTLLVVLLVYFGLKFLIRFLTPYLMRYVAKKAGQKFESAFGQNPFDQTKQQPAGKTTIETPPKEQANSKAKVGEYVDFEEIE